MAQCNIWIDGFQCIYVAGHTGEHNAPRDCADHSDEIRVRVLLDRLDSLQEQITAVSNENAKLRKAILNQSGDNLCWLDSEKAKIPPRDEFLKSCARYHAQISGERGELVGCRTITQLESELERLVAALREIAALRVEGPSSVGPLYGAGLADGFRCASEVAARALEVKINA